MTDLPTVEQLTTKSGDGMVRGSDLYSLAAEVLRDEAERTRQSQDALVKAGNLNGWEPGRIRAHAALCAVAALVDKWRAVGLKAADASEKPPSYIANGADILRETLILEITTRGSGVEVDVEGP